MKKRQQAIINYFVESGWKKAKKVWQEVPSDIEFTRLDYCQARTCQYDGYTFLVSYNTLVAFIDNYGRFIDVLRLVYGYTATSAKHISKFRNKFAHNTEKTWRKI